MKANGCCAMSSTHLLRRVVAAERSNSNSAAGGKRLMVVDVHHKTRAWGLTNAFALHYEQQGPLPAALAPEQHAALPPGRGGQAGVHVQAVWQERMARTRAGAGAGAGASSPVLQGTCMRINHAPAFCFQQTTSKRARATTPPHLEQRAAHSRHKHRHALALHERHGGSETQLGELQRRYALLGDRHNFSLFAEEDPPEEAGRGSRVCVAGSKGKFVLI